MEAQEPCLAGIGRMPAQAADSDCRRGYWIGRHYIWGLEGRQATTCSVFLMCGVAAMPVPGNVAHQAASALQQPVGGRVGRASWRLLPSEAA